MGARESKAAHDSTSDANAPEDYYQLLEVEETATQDEIRVSALDLLLTSSTDSAFGISAHSADWH